MSLFQIYITFVQPHLGYSDILCYSPANGIFIDHLEKIQNKTCLGTQVLFKEHHMTFLPRIGS